jgi:Co/Zn/Cd efflux system component
MIKIKDDFRLPVVLSISLLLILAETAGSIFSKSLSLLSHAGLILAVSFSALPLIANQNLNLQRPEEFRRSQFYSISFNCLMLLIIAVYIIYKSVFLLPNPREINPALTCLIAFSAFIGLIPCIIILYYEMKKNKAIKSLFFKYIFCALLSSFIIMSSVIYYLKDMYFLEPVVSISVAVFIVIQTILLIKQALFILIRQPFF